MIGCAKSQKIVGAMKNAHVISKILAANQIENRVGAFEFRDGNLPNQGALIKSTTQSPLIKRKIKTLLNIIRANYSSDYIYTEVTTRKHGHTEECLLLDAVYNENRFGILKEVAENKEIYGNILTIEDKYYSIIY